MIGYWICAVSSSSRRVVHDQKWIVTGIIDKRQFPRTKNKVYSWRGPPWTMVRSSVELVYRPQWSHPWTSSVDDNEEWTIQSSIQRTDEQTTLGKTRHDRAVDKSMTVAQSSWSSWSPSAVSSRWGSYLRTHRLPRTLGKLLRK